MSYGGRKKHTQALLKSINEKNKKETTAVETVRTGQHFGRARPHVTVPVTAWRAAADPRLTLAAVLLTATDAAIDLTGSGRADGRDE